MTTRALKRVLAALAAASLSGVALATLETTWVRAAAATPPPWGATWSFVGGVVAPLALLVGVGAGVSALLLHPDAPPGWASLRRWLGSGSEAERRFRAASTLTGAAACIAWLMLAARVALPLLGSGLAPASAGAAMAALVVGAFAASALVALGSARLLTTIGRFRVEPGVALAGALLLVIGFLTLAIATGTTSGAGGVLAIFGVMKRPELDLRAPALLLGFALAGYLGPALLVRWPTALLAVLAALPLGWLALAGTREVTPSVALAVERGAPLGKLVLGPLRRLTDRDRDGYSARFGGGDCDDADPARNPAAEDVPGNRLDEDCSGVDAPVVELGRPPTPAAAAPKLPEKLNVLLITVDTLRWDLGFMGNPRPVSPNLDALAKRSTVFERAYALASYTSKSLPPMMIGKYTSETQRGWAHFNRFGKQETFVQERLQRAGIRTISVQGYWYFFNAGYGFERGFDVIDSSAAPAVAAVEGDRSFNSHKLTDAALAQLAKPENTANQFFMWVHYIDPHSEYAPHEEFDFGTSSRDRYDGEVAFTDHHVGRLLDGLAQSKFAERTAVIFTSDHGEAFGEHGMIRHGFELWEELVRVPLIVFVPGAPPGRVEEPRSLVDVAPTILQLAGVPPPSGEGTDFLSGQSLLPDVLAPPGHRPEPRIVFVDMSAGPYNAERQAFIEGDLKLVASGGRPLGLYDLAKDPGEKRDLLDDAALKEKMVARYRAFRRELREVVVRPQ